MKTFLAIIAFLLLGFVTGCVGSTTRLGPDETITITRATLPSMQARSDNYSWGVNRGGYVSPASQDEWNQK